MGIGSLRIRGTVRRDGEPLEAAYIDLLDGEEFIAERRTGPDGTYEFHTTPGNWTLLCRAAQAQPLRRQVDSGPGEIDVSFDVG
jgi:hypothetical protein